MKTPIFMLTSPDSPTLPGAVERINTESRTRRLCFRTREFIDYCLLSSVGEISVLPQIWYNLSNLPLKDKYFHKYLKFVMKY